MKIDFQALMLSLLNGDSLIMREDGEGDRLKQEKQSAFSQRKVEERCGYVFTWEGVLRRGHLMRKKYLVPI